MATMRRKKSGDMQYNLSKNLTLVMYNKFFVYTLNLNLTLTYLTNLDLLMEMPLHLFLPVLFQSNPQS